MINIYPSDFPHSEAFIVGDQSALLKLRDAIDEAIKSSEREAGSGIAQLTDFDTEGEGYNLIVMAADTDELWEISAPYLNPIYGDIQEAYGAAAQEYIKRAKGDNE